VGDALFDCLANFVDLAGEDDKLFVIFPYHLSRYQSMAGLPAGIMDIETLAVETDNLLQYFLQAKPCMKGSNLYTSLLISLILLFPKCIKN